MHLKTFLASLFYTLTLLWLLIGCSSKEIETKTIHVQSMQEVRYTTSIKAEHYRWRQRSGIKVTLLDADTSTLHFIAPKVEREEKLLFTLEAQTAFNTQREKIEVIVSPKRSEENNDTDITIGGGDDSGTNGGGNDDNRSDTEVPLVVMLPDTIRQALADQVILYDRITLEVNATSASRLTAVNDTLAKEHNRTITLHGHKNNGLFYLYNLPLVPGANRIHIRVANAAGETAEANLTVQADANRSVPIAMRAARYEGIKRLDTAVEVATDLNASEYLFDLESDGTIETVQSEGNFSLHLTEEGRYRPRVTVRTKEGLLYSSGPYALALDVKADASQKDPKGATPLDVAKGFVRALIEDDRQEAERMLGNNERMIRFFYGNAKATAFLKRVYSDITKIEQTYNPMGNASIKITYKDGNRTYEGGFEMMPYDAQIYRGRMWLILFAY